MRLLSLGHSSYLLEMQAADGREVRLLADPWLEDYLIGDLLGRFPRVRFDAAALGRLDAIFLSHSHTDHFCPYSLVGLYGKLDHAPRLLLPESLRFLEPLLARHLPAEVSFLRHETPLELGGVRVVAFFNPETAATNEDDVMVLTVDSGRELFLAESDAVLPLYHPHGRAMLAERLTDKHVTFCFLTTKNEGGATMSMLASRDPEDRAARRAEALEATYAEIDEMYTPLEPDETDALWQHGALVRLVGGQGICFPQALGTKWNRVLFPIRIQDRVAWEREVALSSYGPRPIEAFVPGQWHDVAAGEVTDRSPAPGIELLDHEEDREYDAGVELFAEFRDAPLRDEPRDPDAQGHRILETLNTRFLPHLIGARNPPVEHILGQTGGEYRIRVRYGTSDAFTTCDYRLAFEHLVFAPVEATESEPDEHYWANDLDDVLDGRADEFSLFCRRPLPARAQRFWLSLGLPYLNNDLIEKKLALHFERAARGESVESWVMGFYR